MEREREGNEPEKEEIFSRAVGLNTVYQVDTFLTLEAYIHFITTELEPEDMESKITTEGK